MNNISTNIDVKSRNAVKIYSELRKSSCLSKSQLAQKVNLSFASVSNMCSWLDEAGFVKVEENAHSTGGRKAAKISFCSEYAYTLSIDIHHTQHIYMGLIDLQNELKRYVRFEVDEDDTFEQIMENLEKGYHELVKAENIRLLGVCAGISAVLDPHTGILLQSSNPVFERVQLQRYLSELFPGKPVLVDNDANLAGLSHLSDMNRYDSKGKNLLFIFFTQGIGLGIMIDGHLYRGSNGFAGELGHLKVSGITKKCKCGGIGCLRTIATLESIAQDLGESDLLRSTKSSVDYAEQLSKRYLSHEKAVVERIDLMAVKVGEVMADLFDLFNPQEIVLGGNISKLAPHIYQTIKQQCRSLSNLATEVDLLVRIIDRPTYDLVLTGGGERMFQNWLEKSFPELV